MDHVSKKLRAASFSKPLVLSICLMCTAMVFRLLDIFVFRLDDLLGEIIFSKIIGFVMVLLFVKAMGAPLSSIGFNVHNKLSIFLLGVVVTSTLMVLGYAGELLILASDSPQLIIAAIDPKAGVTGGMGFAVFLLLGNIINCFMEEGLFRGIMIPLLNRKYTLRVTLFLQALLFGIWHIPWAFKWYLSGIVSGPGGLMMALLINFLPMVLIGIVFGVMYHYTGSVWTPWISHFIINSILNLVHINTNGVLNAGMTLRMSIFQSAIFILIPVMILLARKLNRARVPSLAPL